MHNNKSARLFIRKGYVLFEGSIPQTVDHRHHALEVFIGLTSPVRIFCGDRAYSGRVLLVDANALHRAPDSPGRKVILMLDPESAVARTVREKFSAEGRIADVSAVMGAAALEKLFSKIEMDRGADSSLLYNHILDCLAGGDQYSSAPDERIRRVLKYLRDRGGEKTTLSSIAEAACLSEGRLVHLFREQVGIPLRRYRLWLRLIDSVKCILEGRPPTESAHRVGFSDYAHLSRTFKRMLGYSLSDIFKSKTSIEIVAGSEL